MNAPVALNAHLWVRHPDDWYVEPSWVSERLFATESFRGNIVDPACGLGRIVDAARSAGLHALGMDIVSRSIACSAEIDFLHVSWWAKGARVDNIVSNPPFKHAQRFVELALERADRKIAMLLPSKWIHGDGRSRWLAGTPLRRVLFITPRPSMPPGPVIEAGIAPGGGKADFAWFVWHVGFDGRPELGWLRRDA
jgi:hypothetical protein